MTASSLEPTSELSDFRKAVFDEFKLVEEKIDRIGEFLFKIRAWAITANSGLILAVMSQKLSPWSIVVGLLATLAFWYLECHQRYLRDGYSNRALALESALLKLAPPRDKRVSAEVLLASVSKNLSKVPGLARSSRRVFSLKSNRSTDEDYVYRFQIILLIIVFSITQYKADIFLVCSAVGEIAVLCIHRISDLLSCG